MKPVRFGVVSTASIARRLVIPAMLRAPECELVAISSRSLERAQAAATQFGAPKAYGALEDMLQDPDVEAVYIASPNSEHVSQAILAARAGRHVLCEKPIGLNRAEALALAQVQQETGVHVAEAFMVRYQPRWLAARDIVRSGRLGRLRQIFATYSVTIRDTADIRFDRALGGGALGDLAVYPITAARFLFEAEPIAATARFEPFAPGGVETAVAGFLEFPEDRNLLFSGALQQGWSQWVRVIGDEGSLEIPLAIWAPMDRETVLRIHPREDRHEDQVEILRFPPSNQYECELTAFSRAVRGEAAEVWPISDAVAGMTVLDAVRRSADTGTRVPLQT